MRAPTLLVIGVTGFVAYSVLFPEGVSEPPKTVNKPPSSKKDEALIASNTLRNPFQMVKPETTDLTNSTSPEKNNEEEVEVATSPTSAVDEDQILESMRLVGTFIDSREQLAIIDNKVYTRGDQLRGSDGSMLPYIITEVRHDRAVVRRGRRDFTIAFSNVPATAAPRAIIAPKPAGEQAMATTQTGAKSTPLGTSRQASMGGNGTGPGNGSPTGNDPAAQKELLQQLLSTLGNSQGGGSSAANPLAGLSSGGATSSSILNSLLTPSAIGAGLDAISGKNDTIGQEGP